MQQNVNRIVVSGQEAKDKLLKGVDYVCDVVGSTLGYRGAYNLFETFDGKPHITMDGFDSLEMMFLSDPIEGMACELVKEGCNKQHDDAGDNTTLVCVLTQSFFQNSLISAKNGKNEIEITKDILESVSKTTEYLDAIATPLTNKLMYDVAKTSSNGDDDVASIVTEAFLKAGEYGTVSHARSFSDETYISFIDGNPIERGYAHEGYINMADTQQVIFDNPLILVTDNHFQTINEIVPFLNIAFPENAEGVPYIAPRPIVFICTMEHTLEATLVANARKGMPICVINPPFIGKKGRENLSDLATIFGCSVLSGVTLSNYNGKEQEFLGTCKKIIINEKDSIVTISDSVNKENIKGVINSLTQQISVQTKLAEKNYLRERIAKLSGGISTVMVGGVTPSEVEEKVARVDDSICAVKSAKDGVLAGGGVALLTCSKKLDLDEVTLDTLTSPFRKILSNAGKSEIKLKKEYPYGYDVKDYKEVNMFDAGIVDTLKGVKSALINASSVSNNLLRTNYVMPFKRTTDAK